MKKHVIVKEIGTEGVCRALCNLLIMRYDGIKERYLPERTKEITCGRCIKKLKNNLAIT